MECFYELMNMRQLRFVCAQPATLYYAWQVEVLINNFIEMGVDPSTIDIICLKQKGSIPEEWLKLIHHYPVNFFFYEDKRKTKNYVSSIRPNLLKQHWELHPYLKSCAIFYHDCDIVFTKPVSTWLLKELVDDDVWYGSDTRWYISHDYIKSKDHNVLEEMCSIMNLPVELIRNNEFNCIGAQYLMKDVTYDFWDRVESDSERLFKEITALNQRIIPVENKLWEEDRKRWEEEKGTPFTKPKYNPVQIWCADMWSVLWGAWRLGHKTVCHKSFEFSWATSTEGDYNKMNIMHNAGVTDSVSGLFYKGHYMHKPPYGRTIEVKDNTASKKYLQWIQKTGKKSCLI